MNAFEIYEPKKMKKTRAIAIKSLSAQSIVFYVWQVQKANLSEEIEHARKPFSCMLAILCSIESEFDCVVRIDLEFGARKIKT